MLLTTTAKVNAVKKLVREKAYDEAVEIADRINPEKVASQYNLSVIADLYTKKGRYDDAKDIYLEMYNRNKTHKVMTGLIEICLKQKEPREAEQYLREFRRMEPENPERLVYRYRVDCMLGKDPEFLIKSLAKLKNEEYTDVWALELAKAYYKNNDRELCAKECHQIMKYFPDSEVSAKAKVLLDACETDTDADDIAAAAEEEVDAETTAESLMDDVSALLEENARAEAVANETVDEKSIAQAMPAHPEPYLRTPEFLSLHQPTGEDRSVFAEDAGEAAAEEADAEPAAVETEAEVAEAATEAAAADGAEYVLPEELAGKIDHVYFDDDDDDDDEDEDDESDPEEDTDEASEDVAEEESGETAEDDSDEDEDDSDEDDAGEDDSDEADDEESDDDDEDEFDEEDDLEDDDLDDEDDDEEDDIDADDDEPEDDDVDDTDEDSDEESDEDDEDCDEENFPEEESEGADDSDVVIAERDYADAELEAVAERIGNEVCNATEEAKGNPSDANEDEYAKMMADTQVVPCVREKKEIPDEDMEKMLYNLLKDIGKDDKGSAE